MPPNFEKLLTFFLAFLIIVSSLRRWPSAWNGGTQLTRAMAGLLFHILAAAVCVSPGFFRWALQDGEAGIDGRPFNWDKLTNRPNSAQPERLTARDRSKIGVLCQQPDQHRHPAYCAPRRVPQRAFHRFPRFGKRACDASCADPVGDMLARSMNW